MQAALRNERTTGRKRAAVLFAMYDYLANVRQNFRKAIQLAVLATDAAPNELQYRANLFRLLLSVRELDGAKRQLDIMRNKDSYGRYTKLINGCENDFDQITAIHNENDELTRDKK